MNSYNKENNLPVISRWIITEAQTGKSKLDVHFSFLNIKFKSFIEDDNYIVVEDMFLNKGLTTTMTCMS